MMASRFFVLLLIAMMTSVLACDDGDDTDGDADGDVDGDADGDSDGDADGDSDGDADGDSDGDSDGDADGDSDGDGDADGYCRIADGVSQNECEACLPDSLDENVEQALRRMFPTAERITAVGADDDLYFVAQADSATLGYAFIGSGYGFEGPVESLTGVDAEDLSVRVELTSAQSWEWTYALTDDFYDQFRCLDLNLLDTATQDWGPYEIDARTGATMSARAVIEGIWQSFARYEAVAP